MRAVHCVWPLAAELGEGPCWADHDEALWFVDITARLIHRLDPRLDVKRTWSVPGEVSFILPDDGGEFIVGLPGALCRLSPASGRCETVVTLEADRPHNRLNDACRDSLGRIWFGSMDDRELEPTGSLYRWDRVSRPIECDQGYVVSNGPALSPDGRVLYHSDSARRVVYRFDVDGEGRLQGKRRFIEIKDGAGCP